ncbi:MAG: CDGSH iron-sulfur domain-containing protein [Bacteroidetes bacterium]|nr:CDGSH iron-sulfur domain-containing protein [Bacteroidota bacterium]
MSDPLTYTSEGIDVQYDVKRCIHAAECVHGSPTVFDPKRKPWIDPSQADADAISATIMNCPTGALKFTRKDGGEEETPDAANSLSIQPNGPLFVRGDLQIETPDGEVILTDTRVALCRCGLSENKPFCDNSHLNAFEDDGTLGDHNASASADETVLRIILAANGPYLLRGPVSISSADDSIITTGKCALCRCGQSSNKPFCDGTHKAVGFEAAAA